MKYICVFVYVNKHTIILFGDFSLRTERIFCTCCPFQHTQTQLPSLYLLSLTHIHTRALISIYIIQMQLKESVGVAQVTVDEDVNACVEVRIKNRFFF